MRTALIILFLIPALAALGHDGYLFYQEHLNPGVFSLELLQKEFELSALGFLWTNYDIESYKLAVSSLAPEEWAQIDKILTLKAFFLGLGFAGLFIVPLSILGLFGTGPFASEGKMSGKGKKSGKALYNRK